MTAKDLDQIVMDEVNETNFDFLKEHITLVGWGQVDEIFNVSGRPNQYYQWLYCLMKLMKPKQVVELGAAAGISTLIMATGLPETSKLYSIDIDPTAWKWMNREYPQVVKVWGDDIDIKSWPKDIDLGKTDIWFVDALHTEEHLRKEVELYKPFWHKDTIVVFDDIHMPGLDKVWDELPYDKFDNSIPCHYPGFGFCIC